MSMSKLDASEICFGLLLNKEVSPEFIQAIQFSPPYGEGVKLLKNGADISELYDKIGLSPVRSAVDACSRVTGIAPLDMVEVLRMAHSRDSLAETLEREAKKLRRGEEADTTKIEAAFERDKSMMDRFTPLSQIEPSGGVWKLTGYSPIDKFIGGIPDANLTIIGAPPGVGKTSLLMKIAIAMAKSQERKAMIFTLEMTSGQIAQRVMDLDPSSGKDDEWKDNILICPDILGVDEIYAEASRYLAMDDSYGMIGIDFADLMLTAKEEEGNVAHLYRQMAKLGKRSGIPVVLLSQLNRQYAEHGGIPRIHNIRWSGMAEAMAALILLIYNPNQIFGANTSKNQSLIAHEGRGYIIEGKSRFGFKMGGVGAIDLRWDGKLAWADKAEGWMGMNSV